MNSAYHMTIFVHLISPAIVIFGTSNPPVVKGAPLLEKKIDMKYALKCEFVHTFDASSKHTNILTLSAFLKVVLLFK